MHSVIKGPKATSTPVINTNSPWPPAKVAKYPGNHKPNTNAAAMAATAPLMSKWMPAAFNRDGQ
jgi:hypothetical protein